MTELAVTSNESNTVRLTKLEILSLILQNERLSATEKCILQGIVLHSDASLENAHPGASRLAKYASLKKRDGVFSALRKLYSLGILKRKSRGIGRSNEYEIDPSALETRPNKQDGFGEKTRPAEKDGWDGKVVPFTGTPRNPTRPANRDTDPSRQPGQNPVHYPVEVGLVDRSSPLTTAEQVDRTPAASVESAAAREQAGSSLRFDDRQAAIDGLAELLNPTRPDAAAAEKIITAQVRLHGWPIVKAAYGRLRMRAMAGERFNKPGVMFGLICEDVAGKPKPAVPYGAIPLPNGGYVSRW